MQVEWIIFDTSYISKKVAIAINYLTIAFYLLPNF